MKVQLVLLSSSSVVVVEELVSDLEVVAESELGMSKTELKFLIFFCSVFSSSVSSKGSERIVGRHLKLGRQW